MAKSEINPNSEARSTRAVKSRFASGVCNYAGLRKRQRTAALQDVSVLSTRMHIPPGLGVRLSSAAFAGAETNDLRSSTRLEHAQFWFRISFGFHHSSFGFRAAPSFYSQ